MTSSGNVSKQSYLLYFLLILLTIALLRQNAQNKLLSQFTKTISTIQWELDSLKRQEEYNLKLFSKKVSDVFPSLKFEDSDFVILVISENYCGPCNTSAIERFSSIDSSNKCIIGIYENERQFNALTARFFPNLKSIWYNQVLSNISLAEPVIFYVINGRIYKAVKF